MNKKLSTGIISIVLCGTLGLTFLGNQIIEIDNAHNEYQLVDKEQREINGPLSDYTYDDAYAIEDTSLETNSPVNQNKISSDIESHLSKDSMGKPYEFMFSDRQKPSLKTFTNDYGFLNPVGTINGDGYELNVFEDKLFEYYGITPETTLLELINKYNAVMSEMSDWINQDWVKFNFNGEFDYTLDLQIDPDGDGITTYEYDKDDLITDVEDDFNSFNGTWMGQNKLDGFTPYKGVDDDSFIEQDDEQPSSNNQSLDLGYAKLTKEHLNGDTSEEYARISFSPSSVDNPTSTLPNLTILANNRDGNMKVTIEDLEPGYQYTINEIYVAYPKTVKDNQPRLLSKIDGSDDYGYLLLTGQDDNYGGYDNFVSLDQPVEEVANDVKAQTIDLVNGIFIREATIRAEELVAEARIEYEELIKEAPFIPAISNNAHFSVIREGRDYITFQVDVFEGTPKEEWNVEWTNGVNYSYNPNTLEMRAKAWKDEVVADDRVAKEDVTFEFKEDTWNYESDTYLTLDNNDTIDHYDSDLEGDSTRTHIYTITGIDDSMKTDASTSLEASTNFDDLSFAFSDNNPYLGDYSGLTLPQLMVVNDLNNHYVSTIGNNSIASMNDEPLFSTKEYNLPLIENTFRWFDVTPNDAKFSFSYIVNDEDTLTEGYLEFDERYDIALLWNEDGGTNEVIDETTGTTSKFEEYTMSESFELKDEFGNEVGVNPGRLEYVRTEEATTQQPVATVTYQLYGLKSYTEYSNFAIYIKSPDSEWVLNDYSNKSESFVIPVDDDRIFDIPNSIKLETPHDVLFYYLIIILLLFIIVVMATIFLVIRWIIWWNKHMRLSLYYDGSASFNQGELIINLLHVNKYPKLWNAHEQDLILIAAGRSLDATFKKDDSLHNGYRIYVTEDTASKRTVLSIMSASKYNQYSIGIKGDHETYHATVLSDQKAKKITRMIAQTDLETYNKTRETILSDIAQKVDKDYGKNSFEKTSNTLVASISDTKTTTTSLRYQVLFPKDSSLLKQYKLDDLNADEARKRLKFYYIYHGELYEFEWNFIGKYGSLYEFDFINLEPSSIYVGITTSLDGGKNMRPSSSLYGVTRETDGTFPSKTDAHLGRPTNPKANSYPIWTEDDARNNLDEKALSRLYDIVTKKHYEDENIDNFMPLQRAHEYYEDYVVKWLNEAPAKRDKWIAKFEKEEAKLLKEKEALQKEQEQQQEISEEVKLPEIEDIESNLEK